MKAIILCGGFGTRFLEKTKTIPKPMIQIGKFPILFHIMKVYERNGINDFILALGYKGKITFDATKPDGATRKLIDVSRLSNMGWKYCVDLEDGLKKTYKWYIS